MSDTWTIYVCDKCGAVAMFDFGHSHARRNRDYEGGPMPMCENTPRRVEVAEVEHYRDVLTDIRRRTEEGDKYAAYGAWRLATDALTEREEHPK